MHKMPNTAIKAESISKRYRIGAKEELQDTLLGRITALVKSPYTNFLKLRQLNHFSKTGSNTENVIWALDDVSFKVNQGEVVGIIGSNGAGKSTLLKILSRITQPTDGRVVINGRLSSLLEVGTGFHPELTGRENVYLNGTILGMSKSEIDYKFDEIVCFSGVEKFIDTPVKRYSSGMQVRLAFSVAAHLDPDVLLIDEVLAVGDAEFQAKCLDKIETISTEKKTIIFVSHNLAQIKRLCSRGIWINRGKCLADGDIETAVIEYQKYLSNKFYKFNSNDLEQGVKFIEWNLGNDSSPYAINDSGKAQIHMYISSDRSLERVNFTISIINWIGQKIAAWKISDVSLRYGLSKLKIEFPYMPIYPGVYYINAGIWDPKKVTQISFPQPLIISTIDYSKFTKNTEKLILNIPYTYQIEELDD